MTTLTIESIFKQFNLNEKEIEAFLELIKIGASPVSKWAHHAKIKRTSMYVILAVSKIITLLDQRQREIEASKSILGTQLPELLALEKVTSITPKVKFYEGSLKVEAMYDEVLKEKSFCAFFHPERVKSMMPNYYHKIALTLKSNGGTAKEILVNCQDAQDYKRLYLSDKHEIAILPKGVTFSSDTIITKDKIFLVGYSKDTIVGTEIWNSELAQTQLTLFELLWDIYSKK